MNKTQKIIANRPSSISYTDEKKLHSTEVFGIILTTIGGMMVFGFFTLMIEAARSAGGALLGDNPGEIAMSILFTFPSAALNFFLLYLGLRKLRNRSLAMRYNSHFVKDEDGIIRVADLASAMGRSERQVLKDLPYLKKKNLLKEFQIAELDDPCILLSKGVPQRWRNPIYLGDGFDNIGFGSKAGIIFGLIFLYSCLELLLAMMVVPSETPTPLIIIIGEMLPMMIGIIIFIRKSHALGAIAGRAVKYNQCWEENERGEIPLSEVAHATGVPEDVVREDLRWLFRRLLLWHCSADLSGQGVIKLSDVLDGEAVFSAIDCPHCGSTAKIRTGRIGKCPYCGNYLPAPADPKESAAALHRSLLSRENVIRYARPVMTTYPADFLNEEAFKKPQNLMFLQFVFGGLLIWSAIFMVSAVLLSPESIPLTGLLIMMLVTALPGAFLCQLGYLNRTAVFCAREFAAIFALSPYTENRVRDLAAQMGADEKEVLQNLKLVKKRNLMCQCEFFTDEDSSDLRRVILLDEAHAKDEYMRVECGHCGSEVTLKRGSVAVCRHCGSFLDENGVTQSVSDAQTDVVLEGLGQNKGTVILLLQDITGLPPKSLSDLLQTLPQTIARTSASAARRIEQTLTDAGAVVSQRPKTGQ